MRWITLLANLIRRKESEHFLEFGPYLLKPSSATQHFLIIGAPGSGKTVTVRVLLSSIFSQEASFRMALYDAKGELLPALFGLDKTAERAIRSGTSRIKVLNPYDGRSFSWNIGADIDSPSLAIQLSQTIVPDGPREGDGNKFFIDASRDLLATAALTLINTRRSWGLRDLIMLGLNQDYIRAAFKAVEAGPNPLPQVARVRDSYLDCDPRTASNIRATLSTALAPFEPIAACWDKAEREGKSVSLKHWASDESRDILVLGNVETARTTVDAANRAIFKRMQDLIIGRREQTIEERKGDNITWFVIDEARTAGFDIQSLLLRGRSKGAAVVLATQTLDGLVDVYGEHKANELISEFQNGAFFRLMEPTASRVAELFGTGLRRTRSQGFSSGPTMSHSFNTSQEPRQILYSDSFVYLESPSKKDGVEGFFRLAGSTPNCESDLYDRFIPDFFQVDEEPISSPWLSGFMPRPVEDEYLRPWAQADWTRLGFPGELPSRTAADADPSASDLMQEYLDAQQKENDEKD